VHTGFRSAILTTLLLLFATTSPVSGENLLGKPTRGILGLKAGVISRMDYDTEWTLQSGVGSCAQLFADFPQGRQFYLTTAFDFYYIGIGGDNQVMIDASVGIKRSFPLRRAKMFLKPAVAVGFAYLAEIGDLPAARFLSLKFYLETHFTIDARKAWVGELGLFQTPTGSNGKDDVTFGPGVFLRWGVAFR
jgi:hypothetical protein